MANVSIKHMTRKYHCQYCKKLCATSESIKWWQHCVKCRTSFLVTFNTGELVAAHLDCSINGKIYQLQLDYTYSGTRIVILPESVSDTIIMVVDFPFLFKNVTPTNLIYKIKTSILFS